ncbi:MAG: triose-phosphate isomerase [Bacteroidia bacterium]
MRQKIVAGNWKMNTNYDEGKELLLELIDSEFGENCQIIVAPPFIHLDHFSKLLTNSKILLGAQNCHIQDRGAFTGEVSASMLKSVGVEFVILGHSERRSYYFEDSMSISYKVNQALAQGLRPIYCCGETLAQRQEDQHFEIIRSQIREGLFHLNEIELLNCVIAYEPVWAIGTGETASPSQAQEIHSFIRKTIAVDYGDMVADNISILYGGSVKPESAPELFNCPDIDGGLIGGAALNAADFSAISRSF